MHKAALLAHSSHVIGIWSKHIVKSESSRWWASLWGASVISVIFLGTFRLYSFYLSHAVAPASNNLLAGGPGRTMPTCKASTHLLPHFDGAQRQGTSRPRPLTDYACLLTRLSAEAVGSASRSPCRLAVPCSRPLIVLVT